MKKSKLSGIYAALILLFLYAPIIILIVFSFNAEKGYSWQGFSLKWYKELFANELIIESFRNTLIVALVSSIFATLLGSLAALGVYSMKNKMAKGLIQNVTNLPLLNPEIVTGVSLMLLFVFFKARMELEFGFGTLLIASAQPLFSLVNTLGERAGTSGYVETILKGLGIVILTQISSDICRDSGESTLAGHIETVGKLELLLLCIPLIGEILATAEKLLEMGG